MNSSFSMPWYVSRSASWNSSHFRMWSYLGGTRGLVGNMDVVVESVGRVVYSLESFVVIKWFRVVRIWVIWIRIM